MLSVSVYQLVTFMEGGNAESSSGINSAHHLHYKIPIMYTG